MRTFRGRHPGEPTLAFLRDPLGLLLRMAALEDDVVMARIGPKRLYLMNRPDRVRALLLSREEGLRKERALRLGSTLLGDGLLTGWGAEQARRRRALLPAFDRSRMPGYGADLAGVLRAGEPSWSDGEVIDLRAEMTRLTLETALRSLWGLPGDALPPLEGAAEEGWLRFMRWQNPLAEFFERLPLPGTIRLREVRRTLREAAGIALDAAQARPDADDARAGFAGLAAQGCPHREGALDEMVTILLAGHETTATALTWSLALLASHPEVENRLHRELDEVLGMQGNAGVRLTSAGDPCLTLAGDHPRIPSAGDLPRLPFTRCVLSEAMRLFPPVWAVSREAAADVELGGRRYPKGSVLMASQFTLHRDPRHWARPLHFDPDRFSDPAPPDPFVYMPFSAGPRGCIGERLAWLQMTLLLAALASRWRVSLLDGPLPLLAGPLPEEGTRTRDLLPGITLRPARPLLAEVRRRPGFAAVDVGGAQPSYIAEARR